MMEGGVDEMSHARKHSGVIGGGVEIERTEFQRRSELVSRWCGPPCNDDPLTARQEILDDEAADETGAAGDEHLHPAAFGLGRLAMSGISWPVK